MKKLLLVTAVLASMGVAAQTWVSTSPQNKKVVLEEFTGIKCQYCPDGHRIASEIASANAGKVFVINIHAGSFATPSTGDPDFRTTEGTAIDAAAGVTGYPSGSVSRNGNPWGQSRSLWTNQVNAVLGQTSPVNVAVKSFVDYTSRTLTTDVEVYYTGNGTGVSNKLSVALIEDNILGPQIDGGNYFPSNWVNGKYKHNHVLRQMLTSGGAFGESLDTITSGKYYYRRYVTSIPASYKNVPCVLHNLSVVAFVAEGNNKILSGDEAHVDFDPTIKTDLEVIDKTVKPGMCGSSITPTVEVLNTFDTKVMSFKVNAIVNGTPYSQTVNQALNKNERVTVTFPAINFTYGGNYDITIGNIENIMGETKGLFDVEMDNDNVSVTGVCFIDAAIPNNNIWCGFEDTKNVAFDKSQNKNFDVHTSATPYGHNSLKALKFYLHSSWNINGKPGIVILGKVDLKTLSSPAMSYYYAYSDGANGGTPPPVKVSISKDCGATYTDVHTQIPVETGQPTAQNLLYIPAISAYKRVDIDLNAYKNDVILARISVTPGNTGNSFWLDEINFNNLSALGVKDEINTNGFELYPNPTSGIVNLKLEAFQTASYQVIDLTGKMVKAGSISNNETTVNCAELVNGVYMLEVTVDGKTAVKKLNVAH